MDFEYQSESDDFLSSGFYQFYTEFNEDFKLVNQNYSVVECRDPLVGQQVVENTDYNSWCQSEISVENSLTDISNYKVSYENGQENQVYPEPDIFELTELDQILWQDQDEYHLQDEKNQFGCSFENLPEKTFLCSDSCNVFLKESSDNLKMNSLKVQQVEQVAPEIFVPQPEPDVDGDKIIYPCNFGQCQKVYAKPAHLKAHIRRHLGNFFWSPPFP